MQVVSANQTFNPPGEHWCEKMSQIKFYPINICVIVFYL